eukprot:GHVN01013643.1.p1 GENE.GHVN01013643.1~~GHVN01013643.1.p1  ORF type:complete len:498 (+),score=26.97 GHVN01013643.1:202-1494(+)
MAADWLQGPYVYALYAEYGFSRSEIATLFVVGFGTSGVVGVFVGALADRFGRKKACICYCFLYIISCLTKHVNNFYVLLLGRFTGGTATSMLFTVFDAWMVHEHHHKKFELLWLNQTFSRATFGNGLVAIACGLLASAVVTTFGKVGPFDVSIIVCICLATIIWFTWNENYGKPSQIGGDESFFAAVRSAFQTMWDKIDIVLCGSVQACFESSMYTFVFMWTPSLPDHINHGLIFACFMTAVIIGSALAAEMKTSKFTLEGTLVLMFIGAAFSLLVPVFFPLENSLKLLSFIVFEVCCGIYFPTFYTLRSIIVPDEARATITNIFRIPLNVIVVMVCLFAGSSQLSSIFLFCVLMQVIGLGAACALHQLRVGPTIELPTYELSAIDEGSDQTNSTANKDSSQKEINTPTTTSSRSTATPVSVIGRVEEER